MNLNILIHSIIIDKEMLFRFNMIIINEILSLIIDLNKQLNYIIK